jgi:hypothetical protein
MHAATKRTIAAAAAVLSAVAANAADLDIFSSAMQLLGTTPLHLTLLARGERACVAAGGSPAVGAPAMIEPYFGAGITYLAIRDSHVANAPEMHIIHIANPDHPALVVEGGVRVRTTDRVSLVGDVKFGPAASTLETFTREVRNDGLQTNVHPLVVSTGVALHF